MMLVRLVAIDAVICDEPLIPKLTPFEFENTTSPLEAVCVPAPIPVMTFERTAMEPPVGGKNTVVFPVATAAIAMEPAEFPMTI